MTPLEAVTAPCPKSPFKDDRHTWSTTGDEHDYLIRRCMDCHLIVVYRHRELNEHPREAVPLCAGYDKP